MHCEPIVPGRVQETMHCCAENHNGKLDKDRVRSSHCDLMMGIVSIGLIAGMKLRCLIPRSSGVRNVLITR